MSLRPRSAEQRPVQNPWLSVGQPTRQSAITGQERLAQVLQAGLENAARTRPDARKAPTNHPMRAIPVTSVTGHPSLWESTKWVHTCNTGTVLAFALGGSSDIIGALAWARANHAECVVLVQPGSPARGSKHSNSTNVHIQEVHAADAANLASVLGGDYFDNDNMVQYLLAKYATSAHNVKAGYYMCQPKDADKAGFTEDSLAGTVEALVEIIKKHKCSTIIGLDFGGDVALPDVKSGDGPAFTQRDYLNLHAAREAAQKSGIEVELVAASPGIDAAAVLDPTYANLKNKQSHSDSRYVMDSAGKLQLDDKHLFIAGQQTEALGKWLREDAYHSIKTSYPAFNQNLHGEAHTKEFKYNNYDMPVYGFLLQRAVANLIENVPQLGTLGKQLHLRNVGTFSLSTQVIDRVPKVRRLLEVAREKYMEAEEAHTKLESFLNACDALRLDPAKIKSFQDWFAWVNDQGIEEGWVTRMEFGVLLQNFGYTDEQAGSLRNEGIKKDDGSTTSLEDYSFRWLGKLLGAYQLNGCLADLVNLAYAMTTLTAPDEKPTENMFVGTINTLSEALQNRDLKHLTWIPTHLQIDGEFDDALCWMVLRHIHDIQGSNKLHVTLQLPADPKFNTIAQSIERNRYNTRHPVRVLRDPKSENGEKLHTGLAIVKGEEATLHDPAKLVEPRNEEGTASTADFVEYTTLISHKELYERILKKIADNSGRSDLWCADYTELRKWNNEEVKKKLEIIIQKTVAEPKGNGKSALFVVGHSAAGKSTFVNKIFLPHEQGDFFYINPDELGGFFCGNDRMFVKMKQDGLMSGNISNLDDAHFDLNDVRFNFLSQKTIELGRHAVLDSNTVPPDAVYMWKQGGYRVRVAFVEASYQGNYSAKSEEDKIEHKVAHGLANDKQRVKKGLHSNADLINKGRLITCRKAAAKLYLDLGCEVSVFISSGEENKGDKGYLHLGTIGSPNLPLDPNFGFRTPTEQPDGKWEPSKPLGPLDVEYFPKRKVQIVEDEFCKHMIDLDADIMRDAIQLPKRDYAASQWLKENGNSFQKFGQAATAYRDEKKWEGASMDNFLGQRALLRAWGFDRLKTELVDKSGESFVSEEGRLRTDDDGPVNIFAKIAAGKMDGSIAPEDAKLGTVARQLYRIGKNKDTADAAWNTEDKAASMSKRHRLMMVTDMDWTWFNVLTIGIDGDAAKLRKAIARLEDMVAEARRVVQTTIKTFDDNQATSGNMTVEADTWSGSDDEHLGLFFHCYPQNSVQSLHMHMVDLKNKGPTTFTRQEPKNLKASDVINGLRDELAVVERKERTRENHASKTSHTYAEVARMKAKPGTGQFFIEGRFRSAEKSRALLHSSYATGIYDLSSVK